MLQLRSSLGPSGQIIKRLVWALLTVCILAVILAPLYMLIKYSLHTSVVSPGTPLPLWPTAPTLNNFRYVLNDRAIIRVIQNSLFIAVNTVLLTLSLGLPAGYVLARYRIPFRKIFLILIISVRLFPDISSVIPITSFFISINLYSSPYAVIFAHTLLSLPYIIFISMFAFEMIPRDIEEQALVMGAGRMSIFIKILVPMIIPSIVVCSVYTFLLSWDEFIFAHYLLGGGSTKTLTLYLADLLQSAPRQNIHAAISVIVSVPVIIFTYVIQRYMAQSIVTGAVK
ncbi:carbohydrate ABC transporter permease [Chitinivibrio alkaliphilus]|uniref:ABC-type sugar transport system, permease component n=1 Tax=Chitinivibrio alkaliphilus ACht1 TaxID=1313304 RepID=U7D7M7_9BACT|nr:carbohydrate ABC transporter permease [Chitinivibrio alkaliphilus]ERP31581.1 ABC-type sugar transport system, permease component [Chitinivibrio alkaliphilus ACht1]